MTTRVGRVLGAVVVSAVTLVPLGMNLLLTTGSLGTDLALVRRDPLRRRSRRGRRSAGPGRCRSTSPPGAGGRAPCAPRARRGLRRRALGGLGAAAGAHPHLAAHELGRPADRARPASCPPLLGTSPTATIAARRVRAWYRDSRLVGIALRTAVLPVFFVAPGGGHGHPGAGRHRHRHAGGVRRAHPDERPRLRRPRLVAARRRRGARAGRTGWAARSPRPWSSGRSSSLTYAVSVALGVISNPVSWLTVVVVSFLASLGLAVGVGAVLPGTAPRTGGNPFAATSGGAAQGCLTAIVSFVGPMLLTLPAVVVVDPDVRLGVGRWVGAGGRHGLRARACSRSGSCSAAPASTGGRPSCSASSPPPRSDRAARRTSDPAQQLPHALERRAWRT